jgi:hypothetical protein
MPTDLRNTQSRNSVIETELPDRTGDRDSDSLTDCIRILRNRDYEENGGSPA